MLNNFFPRQYIMLRVHIISLFFLQLCFTFFSSTFLIISFFITIKQFPICTVLLQVYNSTIKKILVLTREYKQNSRSKKNLSVHFLSLSTKNTTCSYMGSYQLMSNKLSILNARHRSNPLITDESPYLATHHIPFTTHHSQ